jgi:cation-transporting P-type ATPase I
MIEKPQTISVLHTLPGRIRLHLSNWPGQRARHLEKLLRQIPGVCRAKANPLTHNVLIGFDAQRLSQKTLLGHLQSMLPLPLEDTAASAGSTNHPVEDDSLPPVIEEWVSGPRQRARLQSAG